jgi:hypothetical protein
MVELIVRESYTEKQKRQSEPTRTFQTILVKVFATTVENRYSQTIKTFVSNGFK